MPGTVSVSSERLTSGDAAVKGSTAMLLTAAGASNWRCSLRLALTTTSGSVFSSAVWAVAAGIASSEASGKMEKRERVLPVACMGARSRE